ncbi:MAG TPA: DMT family transporter [Nocardioidaceae bacterium]|jgi:drug/metabolite transporter (DMT)-like permease
MLVYVFAVVAALMFGLGSVIQQRVAFDAPPGKSLRPSLLLWLVRQPVWLIGVVTAFIGNAFSASALGMGGVALVQPLLVTRLLFALPLSAVWARQRLGARDWLGAVATAGGLGVFVALGHPRPEQQPAGHLMPWLYTAAVVAVGTTGLVAAARRLRPNLEAPMLGAGAGMLFGMQGGLMAVAVNRLSGGGILALLAAPSVYAVVVTAVVGTLLAQSAYEMAPLHASYPALASVEPLTGIGIGVGVLGGTLATGTLPLAVGVAGLVVMTVGIYLLATSPLVAGQAEAMRRRQQEEAAARAEQHLEHALDALERDLRRLERVGPKGEERAIRCLDRDSAQVEQDLGALAELNVDAFEREDRLAAVQGRPNPEHLRVMEQWRQDRCDREERLRRRAERLAGRLHELRR